MQQNLWQQQMAWACFVSRQHRLDDAVFYDQALDAARSIMRLARGNVERLVERLRARGYRFADPKRAYLPPPSDVGDWPARFAAQGVYIPVALMAWLHEVGTVDLSGTAPEWSFVGYHGLADGEVFYTDPLVVDLTVDYIEAEIADWQDACAEYGADEVGPFRLAFAPDSIHKANVSGGEPYAMDTACPAADTLVFNERHGFGFVAHVRHSFEWGGFPGFELMDTPPSEFLAEMRRGLEAL